MRARSIAPLGLTLALLPSAATAQGAPAYRGLPRLEVHGLGFIGRTFDGTSGVERAGLGVGWRVSHRFGLEGNTFALWVGEPTPAQSGRTVFAGATALANFDLAGTSENVRLGAFVGGGFAARVEGGTEAVTSETLLLGLTGLELRAGLPHFSVALRVGVELAANLGGTSPFGGALGTEFRVGVGGYQTPRESSEATAGERPVSADTLDRHLCEDLLADLSDTPRAPYVRNCAASAGAGSARSGAPICSATFRRNWGPVAVQSLEGTCDNGEHSAFTRDIPPGRCALVLAQATALEGQDLDLRVLDAARDEIVSDVAADGWPMAFACNFGAGPAPLGLEGLYSGAPEGVAEGYAAITRIELPMPSVVTVDANGRRTSVTPAVRSCEGARRVDDRACGFHLQRGSARTLSVPDGGTLCVAAPSVAGVTATLEWVTGGGSPERIESFNGLRWREARCVDLPEDQGAYRLTVTAGGSVGAAVVVAHDASPQLDRRAGAALAGALRIGESDLTRATGDLPRGATGFAGEGNPLTFRAVSVPRFSAITVRAATAFPDGGHILFTVDQAGTVARPADAPDDGGLDAPRAFTWANATNTDAQVDVSVAPEDFDRVAATVQPLWPGWSFRGQEVRLARSDAAGLRACRTDVPLGTAPARNESRYCVVDVAGSTPVDLRVLPGANLCFASAAAPELRVEIARPVTTALPFFSLAADQTVNTPAACVSPRSIVAGQSGPLKVRFTRPTVVYLPGAATTRARRGRAPVPPTTQQQEQRAR